MTKPVVTAPLTSLGYIGSKLDRISEQRRDHARIEAAMHHADAGVYVLAGDIVVLKKRGEILDPLLSPAEARGFGEPLQTMFVGLAGEAARTAISIASETAERAKASGDYAAIDLRSVAVQGLAHDHLPALASAKSVLLWHAAHRFCANCGNATAIIRAGWARRCTGCEAEHFPRTDPVVIMLAEHEGRALVARQASWPAGRYSALAGFVEVGESIEEAVTRETLEEAGVRTRNVRYVASQPWPFPSSLMIACIAEADDDALTLDANELEDGFWVTRDEARAALAGDPAARFGAPPPYAIAHSLLRHWVES